MRIYDIILKKRNGETLTDDEIRFFVRGAADGSIPDEQLAAFLMAAYFRPFDDAETAILTDAMARSGEMLDLSSLGACTVDKHSTGGVGDKTTLIVAPIAASLGCRVAKMSGRGLGHTGGTIDKLESIPGYKTSLAPDAFLRQVKEIGIAVVGQTGTLAPADKKLYALRDVTATVDSLPLIASSVMSKKIAAGSASIVLDVKVGSGAFMKTKEEAEALARMMIDIGTRCGRKVRAVLTDMDRPLGRAVGNALEVREAVETLRGAGSDDLTAVSLELAAQMASLALSIPTEEARRRAEEALRSGRAAEKMAEWVARQGGDVSCILDPSKLPTSAVQLPFYAPEDGTIARMDASGIGSAAVLLGAGRERKSDAIDPAAGIELFKKTGDAVHKGDVIAVLHAQTSERAKAGLARMERSVVIGEAPKTVPLIYKVME